MAYHRQAPGGIRMPNDLERRRAQSCYNLGVGYPPNPVEVWPQLMFHKDNGQRCLNNNNLHQALNHYVMGLQASELFPGLQAYREERTKNLCNMSLVLFKMRRFKDAEDNAIEAMSMNPAFIKSYWRAYQAVIGGHNGPFNALPYVMEGLRRSLQGDGTQQDVITFLTELCTFIPSLYNSAATNERFDNMMIPNIMEKEIWTKTLQKLSGNRSWDSLRMLVLGNSGPMCLLRGFCREFNMACVDIGSLLELPQNDLNAWGINLAEKLIQQGAPVENITSRFKKPALHVGVQISINTGSTKLLECILRCYQHNMDAKNAQNAKGETGLHLAVMSDKAYEAAVSKVTEVLLKHGCDPSLKDHQGKKAIDYVEQESTVYHQLKKADKTVDELRRDLEAIKQRGNEALKRGLHSEALKLYKQALDISKQSKKLYKEAAIVYSNTAKVYVDLNDVANALPNAMAAVNCDKGYHKGHWWKGKVLSQMGAFQEGFEAFMEGFKIAAISSDVKLNFLIEAITLLQQLNDGERESSYIKLKTVDKDVLAQALQKLSSTGEWKCVAYLILGPNLEPKLFRGAFTGDKIRKLRSGVAANCSMLHLELRTVFFFILRKDFCSVDNYWLDAVLVAICCVGNKVNIDTLAVDDFDRPLHAVARFGLLTGRTSLLDEALKQPLKVLEQEFTNGRGDTVFHTITKMLPLPQEKALIKVTLAFLEKGLSPMVPDAVGYLPVDYLNKSYGGEVFDLFFRKVVSFSWEKVTQLKDEGNQKYNSGDVLESIELYTDAINLVEGQSKNRLREVPGKEIAVLYGNRAEGFIKIGNYESALEDSKTSVHYSGHWYKGYFRVGRALKGLRRYQEALQEFIKAYKRVDNCTEEKWRIEIMSELTFVCCKMPRDTFDRKAKLTSFPEGQGNVWVKAAYELIRKDEWERAGIAYNQFKLSPRRGNQITFSLKPICNSKKLSGFSWAVDLILYFLECGADRKTLSLSEGDTCLHAAARICLIVDTSCALVEWLLKKYKEVDLLDKDGNTALHAAAKEKCNHIDRRNHIIRLLINANVDPNIKNKRGEQAIDLLPVSESNNRELLRMAMHRVGGRVQGPVLSASNQYPSKVDPFENKQSPKPKQVFRKPCEECEELLIGAESCFTNGSASDGYGKLTKIFNMRHQSRKHQPLVDKAINSIITKLGEKSVPEIAPCLTSMPKEYYQRVIDGLIQKQKWRQLNAVVRKYRLEKGSDKLKGFASSLSIVPVIDDPDFKGLQEEQIQVIANMLNSGATMGSDNGQTALNHATRIDHYKVVADLIKRGADLSQFTLAKGDTPIHAIVTLVLQKEKALPVLEFVMDQYDKDPQSFPHLDPCQQNKAGDCLFHLLTKAKCTPIVVKVTEFLCNRKISAAYYNKDRKLPIHYVTKKNDRLLQYIRLAALIKPVGVQKFGPDVVSEDEEEELSGDEMKECPRKDEVHSPARNFSEKVVQESERDQIKRRIEELIRLVSEGKSAKPLVHQDFSLTFDEKCTNRNEAHEETKDHTTDNLTNITDTLKESGTLTENQDKVDDDSTSRQEKRNDPSKNKDDNSEGMTENQPVNDLQGPEETKGIVNDQETLNNEMNNEIHHRLQNRMEPDGQEKEDSESVLVEEVVEDINDDKCAEEDIESESDEEDGGEEEFDAEVFDNLEWEVECTAEVWKTLRDKHVPQELKNRIMQKIRMLASGDWHPVLCKKLRNVPKTLDLFEAKFSKGSRILWEKAVAFSPRCSETAERRLQYDTEETTQPVRGGRIYSETIRVWEIVFDHDKIHRSVERIKQSHHRGEECIIQKKLRGIKSDPSQLTLTSGSKIYPKMFAENDVPVEEIVEQREEMHQYFPPASSNDTEYHILKFYSFSSTLVNHVLQNTDTKVDFPFRVTDLEHAIINLPSKAPILLLGRSGTGKTTCCLYRLWSQFLRYWVKALEADAPLIPRSLDFIHKEEDKGREQEDEDGMDDDHSDSEQGACGQTAMSSRDQPNRPLTDDYDHIHQLFITKNLVLCSEVQKNFHELSHAESRLTEHFQHEAEDLPNKFQDVGDYSYPLFLTSRQLLMMMDASIGPPYFFDRKEDGSLKADVAGWSDDGPLNILLLLEEDSDSEEEQEGACHQGEGEEPEVEHQELPHTAGRKNKVDPRREITYPVFVEDVWPKIKKNKKMNYHPSLLWTEIMSFIKGSFEALAQPSGYLSLEDYLKLGRKRAPNFSADRQPIYQFFKAYEHFKKQNRLFDETDLVFNIYGRLKRMEDRPWVIHQVYVDETQDFTQAELSLLIRMCQNPNDMFLTGDTAQSIMRGISFRFSDLRSLFFHTKKSMQAMGKTSAVEVPKKVYQLTHNYRSHAGILSLASSVLDLMVEFFPESFDRLQRDQGLFPGPQPILLESCSFGDLAVLLRGNKRRTSHIEFGAHQAILVVDEAARDAIPEELRLGLVLTIFEAKGLEFDDVLIYNFFKDSQAVKEWRVVTDFLERLLANQRETVVTSGQQESLVEIDEDVLQLENRPRPLDFDPNQHKVLNSELKHLYTALTRARVNVWIFDEDQDKRAPMFEYFNARKLVKSITVSEINEESLSETVFAEKSSKEDWIGRGEDFMRHSLYIVAAKCFGMAGDLEREKVALAHVQALKASRLKEHPREMRREFLKAAEMYLECEKPGKAAICLQNAKELVLAAELFEKLGQYERAADIYKRLKLSIASSRCYEQLGNFDKAVEVLYDNENYDMAMDSLKRYQMRIKDYTQNNTAVPGQLVAYKPADYYTAEKLSHKAAEKFHRLGNMERMLDAIDSIPKLSDRVEFLKKRNYIQLAAERLKENGELKEATQMLLIHGYLEDATAVARTMDDKATLGHCILVSCRVFIDKSKEESDFPVEIPEFQQTELKKTMTECVGLFESCQQNDELGEMHLLQADILKSKEMVKNAWTPFARSKPVSNIAGCVECVNWLIEHNDLSQLDEVYLKHIITGVGHVFTICCVLLKPIDAGNLDRVNKFLQFYGLSNFSNSELELYPKERPFCLTILKSLIGNVDTDKDSYCRVDMDAALQAIINFLLKRTLKWVDNIWEALVSLGNRSRICSFFEAGLECPNVGNVDNNCTRLHKQMLLKDMQSLIRVDLLLIEFEVELHVGVDKLNKICPTKLRSVVEMFLAEGERDNSEKYKACHMLLDDLMPFSGHPMVINDDSRELIRYLQRSTKVLSHYRDFLKNEWKIKTTNANKTFRCQAARETELYFLMEFGYHLFGLDFKCKLVPSPLESVQKLERDIDNEGGPRKENMQYMTLFPFTDRGGKIYMECIGKRFMEAYSYISSPYPNPFEAVYQFSKFVIFQKKRPSPSQLPDLHHYAMWQEFYLTVGMILTAKLKTINSPDFLFVLPSNYLGLLKFVEATFPNQASPVILGIDRWQPKRYQAAAKTIQLQERLKYIGFGVCGFGVCRYDEHKIKILAEALNRSLGDPHFYAIAERIIVLQLVLVLNVGKVMPEECERSLMESLSHIKLPEKSPDRLQRLAKYMKQKVQGIYDVAEVLESLLKTRKRGEELLICKWKPDTKQKLETTKLEKMDLFSRTFFNSSTIGAMKGNLQVDTDEADMNEDTVDDQLTEEEIDNKMKEKRQQEENEKLNQAATKITKFIRRVAGIHQVNKDIANRKKELAHGEFKMFETVKVTDKYCGFCGCYFEDKLAESLKYEHSEVVGADSIMNRFIGENPMATSNPAPNIYSAQLGEDLQGGSWEYSGGFDGMPGNYGDNTQINDKMPTSTELGPHGALSSHTVLDGNIDGKPIDLKTVKQEHTQQQSHLTKKMEYDIFEKKCKTKILPKLHVIQEFFENRDYHLDSKEISERKYDRVYIEIEQIQKLLPKIETKIFDIFRTRHWSSTGEIEQLVTELGTAFGIVRPYVEEIYNKQKENEGHSASASNSKDQQDNVRDDDEDKVEDVVNEPSARRKKGKHFRNSQWKGKRWKKY